MSKRVAVGAGERELRNLLAKCQDIVDATLKPLRKVVSVLIPVDLVVQY